MYPCVLHCTVILFVSPTHHHPPVYSDTETPAQCLSFSPFPSYLIRTPRVTVSYFLSKPIPEDGTTSPDCEYIRGISLSFSFFFFTRMSAFFSLNFVCSTLGYVGWHQLPHVSFSWWCRRVVLKSVLALRWGSLHSMHGSFYLAHKVWPWFSQNFHSIHSMLDNVAEGARKWRGNSLPPTERGFKDTGILPLMMKEIVAPENILNVLNIL